MHFSTNRIQLDNKTRARPAANMLNAICLEKKEKTSVIVDMNENQG